MNVRDKIIATYGKPPAAPISISFRNDQGKRMHGAFYDHYAIRQITGHETIILKEPNQILNSFQEFVNSSTFALGVGDARGTRIILPATQITQTTNQKGYYSFQAEQKMMPIKKEKHMKSS